jgi:hypothetical protein
MKRKIILWAFISLFTVTFSSCGNDDEENGPSSDATLKNLTVSEGSLSPAFKANITEYTVNVDKSITSISVTGTANYGNATVLGNVTAQALTLGDNHISIAVTAEDGTVKTYLITVDRDSSSPFDGRLSGTIVGGAGLIDTVAIIKKFPVNTDGSFDFVLPTPVEEDLKTLNIKELFMVFNASKIIVTPADAKIILVDGSSLRAYKDGKDVGNVYSRIEDDQFTYFTYLTYWYANKDVKIVGTDRQDNNNNPEKFSYCYSFNCSLKAGWNIIKTESSTAYSIKLINLDKVIHTTGDIPNFPWVF